MWAFCNCNKQLKMMRRSIVNIVLIGLIVTLFTSVHCLANFITPLKERGYSVIPSPQNVKITENDIVLDDSWSIDSRLPDDHIAFQTLKLDFENWFGIELDGKGNKKIELSINENIFDSDLSNAVKSQGYIIDISEEKVSITGGSDAGLLYGVQTLKQLVRQNSGVGNYIVPEGSISDWPDLELRFIHWDTKHHQDRMATLKRFIDQASYFKINAIAFEMEDKYEYPSHPIIGAPGAFTKEQMQELTEYALKRFIELVPSVQAPSHMAFVLKHEEFAHVRADGSNYHSCMCDEEAMELIFDMYQDMIDATPGVEYFFVSTDEVYYAGICDKCEKEYNEENRSLTWVNFVNRVYDWMQERNRKVVAWVEYPLWPEHIELLPAGLIDGITVPNRSEEWLENENEAGIKQLAYSSMQGAEYLFPNYFPTKYRNGETEGRLKEASQKVQVIREKGAKPIGSFAAAWDDAGLHNETFWLGWATVTQYSWTVSKPSLNQNNADFMDAFYGYDAPFMVNLYRDLEVGARFYESVWDTRITDERDPVYGSSYGKGAYDKYDPYLKMPEIPHAKTLDTRPVFQLEYGDKIEEAVQLEPILEQVIDQLHYKMNKVSRNRYNLEVFLSIAELELFTVQTIIKIAELETTLVGLEKRGRSHLEKVQELLEVNKAVGDILSNQNEMWDNLKTVWQKSRFEKGMSVNGKHFVHILDDVKDHFADRRVGLDYMLAPFQRMEIPEWKNQMGQLIKDYAQYHDVKISEKEKKRLED